MFGEQAFPVRSAVAAPELSRIAFFSRTTLLTASATPELGVSAMASTFSLSTHDRVMLTPTSGLFWWSPLNTSMFQPLAGRPESSTAILTAATEFGPPMSAYRLDMSLSTPILTFLSSASAEVAKKPAKAISAAARPACVVFMNFLHVLTAGRLSGEPYPSASRPDYPFPVDAAIRLSRFDAAAKA